MELRIGTCWLPDLRRRRRLLLFTASFSCTRVCLCCGRGANHTTDHRDSSSDGSASGIFRLYERADVRVCECASVCVDAARIQCKKIDCTELWYSGTRLWRIYAEQICSRHDLKMSNRSKYSTRVMLNERSCAHTHTHGPTVLFSEQLFCMYSALIGRVHNLFNRIYLRLYDFKGFPNRDFMF